MGVLTVIVLPVLLTVVAAEAGQGAGAAATVPADWTLAETRYEGCRYHVVFERKDLSTEKCQEQAEEPSLSHIHNTIKAMLREGKPNNKDINECTTSPCQHGRCENYPGGYRCTCSPGWTGKNCQQDINECIRNPCQHGSCVNKDGGYDCNCLEGWTGTNCQQQARLCQSGWSEYNNNCYKLFKEKVTWSTANKKCKQHSSNLASVGSAGENNFIARLITDAPKGYSRLDLVWFGLTLDGQWKWTDGSRLSYKNWAPHEPFSRTVFGRDEKCANLFSKDNRNQLRSWFLSTKGKKGQWNNDVCSNHHPYVCEAPIIGKLNP
ncbi:aggrecan core protein-like [Branchiostoma floridae x Branchiostoma belcheri]